MFALRQLFGHQAARYRAVAALPGLVALLFIGHALEDGGLPGAMPYAVIIGCSVWYIARPNWFAWGVLFLLFFAYVCAVASVPQNGPMGEWLFFLFLGFAPASLLVVARPRGAVPSTATGPANSLPDA